MSVFSCDMSMRRLLRDMPAGGSSDSLLARIRGRRSFLVRDWDRLLLTSRPVTALSPAPWRKYSADVEGWALRALQQEFFWVFSRMDEQLRRMTAPFFWLAELRPLAVSLRLLTGGTKGLDYLLKNSLLADNIKDLLRNSTSCSSAVSGLSAVLGASYPRFSELDEIYRSDGTGPLEEALYDVSLQIMSRMPLHPELRRYTTLMIDSRNLATVAKRLRWRQPTSPHLLQGGTLTLPRLTELFERRDTAGLLHLAMRLGGEAGYRDSADPEQVLYEAQRRVMRRIGRESDGIGTIIDYLWRCGNEAANIGILERLESMGSECADKGLRR